MATAERMPEAVPEANLEAVPEANLEVNPEVVPEANLEVNPEVTPEVTLGRVDGVQTASSMPYSISWQFLQSVDSTNRYLLATAHPPFGTYHVCIAREQTAGYGRRGRHWKSMPGRSLTFSLARTLGPMERPQPALTLAIAVGIARALTALGYTGFGIKWPNDLLRHTESASVLGGKLAGILTEYRARGMLAQDEEGKQGQDVRRQKIPQENVHPKNVETAPEGRFEGDEKFSASQALLVTGIGLNLHEMESSWVDRPVSALQDLPRHPAHSLAAMLPGLCENSAPWLWLKVLQELHTLYPETRPLDWQPVQSETGFFSNTQEMPLPQGMPIRQESWGGGGSMHPEWMSMIMPALQGIPALLLTLVMHVVAAWSTFQREGLSAFLEEYQRYDLLSGRWVEVHDLNLAGRVLGIEPSSGALRLATNTGTRILHSGEISLRL
jgi:biotin-(acetyl-CoA carboxylase) ligase